MVPPENVNLDQIRELSGTFVQLNHLYVRLPNGQVNPLEKGKTYMLNAIDIDSSINDGAITYTADEITIKLNTTTADNQFSVYNIKDRLSGDKDINITQGNYGITNLSVKHDTTLVTTTNGLSVYNIYPRFIEGPGISITQGNNSNEFKTTLSIKPGQPGQILSTNTAGSAVWVNSPEWVTDDQFLNDAQYVKGCYYNGGYYEYLPAQNGKTSGYYLDGDYNKTKLTNSQAPASLDEATRYLKFTFRLQDGEKGKADSYIDITELFNGFNEGFGISLADNSITLTGTILKDGTDIHIDEYGRINYTGEGGGPGGGTLYTPGFGLAISANPQFSSQEFYLTGTILKEGNNIEIDENNKINSLLSGGSLITVNDTDHSINFDLTSGQWINFDDGKINCILTGSDNITITEAGVISGLVYDAGFGLATSGENNHTFYLTGSILSGDGVHIFVDQTTHIISTNLQGDGSTISVNPDTGVISCLIDPEEFRTHINSGRFIEIDPTDDNAINCTLSGDDTTITIVDNVISSLVKGNVYTSGRFIEVSTTKDENDAYPISCLLSGDGLITIDEVTNIISISGAAADETKILKSVNGVVGWEANTTDLTSGQFIVIGSNNEINSTLSADQISILIDSATDPAIGSDVLKVNPAWLSGGTTNQDGYYAVSAAVLKFLSSLTHTTKFDTLKINSTSGLHWAQDNAGAEGDNDHTYEAGYGVTLTSIDTTTQFGGYINAPSASDSIALCSHYDLTDPENPKFLNYSYDVNTLWLSGQISTYLSGISGSDSGMVLHVNDDNTGFVWKKAAANIQSGIGIKLISDVATNTTSINIDTTGAQDGYILKYKASDGTVYWSTDLSGSEKDGNTTYGAGYGITLTNSNSSLDFGGNFNAPSGSDSIIVSTYFDTEDVTKIVGYDYNVDETWLTNKISSFLITLRGSGDTLKNSSSSGLVWLPDIKGEDGSDYIADEQTLHLDGLTFEISSVFPRLHASSGVIIAQNTTSANITDIAVDLRAVHGIELSAIGTAWIMEPRLGTWMQFETDLNDDSKSNIGCKLTGDNSHIFISQDGVISTNLKGDGSTINVAANGVISLIGSTGKTYTGGRLIQVSTTTDGNGNYPISCLLSTAGSYLYINEEQNAISTSLHGDNTTIYIWPDGTISGLGGGGGTVLYEGDGTYIQVDNSTHIISWIGGNIGDSYTAGSGILFTDGPDTKIINAYLSSTTTDTLSITKDSTSNLLILSASPHNVYTDGWGIDIQQGANSYTFVVSSTLKGDDSTIQIDETTEQISIKPAGASESAVLQSIDGVISWGQATSPLTSGRLIEINGNNIDCMLSGEGLINVNTSTNKVSLTKASQDGYILWTTGGVVKWAPAPQGGSNTSTFYYTSTYLNGFGLGLSADVNEDNWFYLTATYLTGGQWMQIDDQTIDCILTGDNVHIFTDSTGVISTNIHGDGSTISLAADGTISLVGDLGDKYTDGRFIQVATTKVDGKYPISCMLSGDDTHIFIDQTTKVISTNIHGDGTTISLAADGTLSCLLTESTWTGDSYISVNNTAHTITWIGGALGDQVSAGSGILLTTDGDKKKINVYLSAADSSSLNIYKDTNSNLLILSTAPHYKYTGGWGIDIQRDMTIIDGTDELVNPNTYIVSSTLKGDDSTIQIDSTTEKISIIPDAVGTSSILQSIDGVISWGQVNLDVDIKPGRLIEIGEDNSISCMLDGEGLINVNPTTNKVSITKASQDGYIIWTTGGVVKWAPAPQAGSNTSTFYYTSTYLNGFGLGLTADANDDNWFFLTGTYLTGGQWMKITDPGDRTIDCILTGDEVTVHLPNTGTNNGVINVKNVYPLLAAGAGISIASAAAVGTSNYEITTITNTALNWEVSIVSNTSVTAANNHRYITRKSGTVDVTLPANPTVGDRISVFADALSKDANDKPITLKIKHPSNTITLNNTVIPVATPLELSLYDYVELNYLAGSWQASVYSFNRDTTYTSGRFIEVSTTKDDNGNYPISCMLSGDGNHIFIDQTSMLISTNLHGDGTTIDVAADGTISSKVKNTNTEYSSGRFTEVSSNKDGNNKYPINNTLSGDEYGIYISGNTNDASGIIKIKAGPANTILSSNGTSAQWVSPNYLTTYTQMSSHLRVANASGSTTSNSNTTTKKDVYILLTEGTNTNGNVTNDRIKLVGTSNINISNSYDQNSKINTITFTGPNLGSYLTDQDETHLKVTSGNALTANYKTDNTNTYVNLTQGPNASTQTVRNSIQIKGDGTYVVVNSDDGVITISGAPSGTVSHNDKIFVGGSTATDNAAVAWNSNGSHYILHSSDATTKIRLSGTNIKFKTDANGVLTISGTPDNNTTYTEGRYIEIDSSNNNAINCMLSGDDTTIKIVDNVISCLLDTTPLQDQIYQGSGILFTYPDSDNHNKITINTHLSSATTNNLLIYCDSGGVACISAADLSGDGYTIDVDQPLRKISVKPAGTQGYIMSTTLQNNKLSACWANPNFLTSHNSYKMMVTSATTQTVSKSGDNDHTYIILRENNSTNLSDKIQLSGAGGTKINNYYKSSENLNLITISSSQGSNITDDGGTTTKLNTSDAMRVKNIYPLLTAGAGINLSKIDATGTGLYDLSKITNTECNWIVDYREPYNNPSVLSTINAEHNHRYIMNSSSGVVIKLPNSPSNGDRISVFVNNISYRGNDTSDPVLLSLSSATTGKNMHLHTSTGKTLELELFDYVELNYLSSKNWWQVTHFYFGGTSDTNTTYTGGQWINIGPKDPNYDIYPISCILTGDNSTIKIWPDGTISCLVGNTYIDNRIKYVIRNNGDVSYPPGSYIPIISANGEWVANKIPLPPTNGNGVVLLGYDYSTGNYGWYQTTQCP